MSDHPFYTDANVWQGAAAVAALVLSQLPPIKLWFRRAKLDVECFDRMALKHDVGAAAAEMHVTITNTGGTDIRVKRIGMAITRGEDLRELDARGYYEKASKEALLFTPFTLRPKESWGYNVNFFKFAPREIRQEYSTHAHALRMDIARKANARDADPQARANQELVEGDPALVAPMLTLFDRQFFWRPGEYQIVLSVETDKPHGDAVRKFRCTLFEAESERLRVHRDHLKHGNGVFWYAYPVEPYITEIQPVP